MPQLTKYKFKIRTRKGLTVEDLLIQARDQTEAVACGPRMQRLRLDILREVLDELHGGDHRFVVFAGGEQLVHALGRRVVLTRFLDHGRHLASRGAPETGGDGAACRRGGFPP